MSSPKSAATKDARKPQNAGKKSQTKPEPDNRELVLAEVFEWVAAGKTLREYCRQEGKPSYPTIYRWMNENEEALKRFARAREDGADAIAEEALEILDEFPMIVEGGENSGSRVDTGHVAWMKNRA